MDELTYESIDDIDSDEQLNFVMLYLYYSSEINRSDQNWNKFSEDLMYKNRFLSQNEILIDLEDKASSATYIIPKNTFLYRARLFDKDLFDSFAKSNFPDLAEIVNNTSLALKSKDVMPIIYMNGPSSLTNKFEEAYAKWQQKRFQGYSAKDSGAPPKGSATAGRANPEHISYLYLCEDVETPIYEVRPTIGQSVSVAKFKVTKDLCIFDLTMRFPKVVLEGHPPVPSLFDSVGTHFSIPYTGKEDQYLPTQYISEKIKNMGFDGLRFESSLHKGGKNIVLFAPDSCKAVSSKVHTIQNIQLSTKEANIMDVYSTT